MRISLSATLLALAALGGASLVAQDSRASGDRVLVTEDLARVGQEAAARRLPVLVLFAAEHCEYCERLEAEFLAPMLISGDYGERVIIRKFMVDSWGTVRDFQGRSLGANELAERYGVDVTPTVMVFDAKGRQLARKLIGLNNVHFYGAYLDQAIDRAYAKLNPS